LLQKHPEADMIYSDEDKISEVGHRFKPYFKPDWSPDLFFSQMYTAHLAVYRRTLVEQLGGYRVGFEGAQDYDMVLRLTEHTDKIFHIPTILYSWRRAETSTAAHSSKKPYAAIAAQRALEEALVRRGRPATLEGVLNYPGHHTVRWGVEGNPRVSIIILTRDKAEFVDRCISSIFHKSTYANFEIVLIDNGSRGAGNA